MAQVKERGGGGEKGSQYCSTSLANQALRSLANVGFQNRGVCLQAFLSFPSPSPPPSFIFWLSFHFSRGQNRKSRSSVFLCSKTKRKRLLRRLVERETTRKGKGGKKAGQQEIRMRSQAAPAGSLFCTDRECGTGHPSSGECNTFDSEKHFQLEEV